MTATGETGGIILCFPQSARAEALADALTGLASSDSLKYNPASLYTEEKNDLGFFYLDGIVDVSLLNLTYLTKYKDDKHISLRLVLLDAGEAEIYKLTGETDKLNAQKDILLSLGASFPIRSSLFAGIAGNYIASNLAEDFKSSSISISCGIFLKDISLAQYNSKLSLGASLSNLGSGLKYESKASPLPIILSLGSSLNYEDKLLALTSFDYILKEKKTIGLGLEYKIVEYLCVRGGYRLGEANQGLCLGFGTKKNFGNWIGEIDYAYHPIKELQSNHRINFNIKW